MNGAIKHPLRVGARLIWLSAELIWAALCFVPCVLLRSGSSDLAARALWLQAGCRRVLRVFNAQVLASGAIPTQGLLVSNHLSYLDVLVLGALTPSIFVAKSDVRNWPIFGWFARIAGTLFAHRERRMQVGALTKELQTVLDQGILVVLFPEGTSSNGQSVLPFKSALLKPASDPSRPLSVSLIEYRLEDGDVGEEVCYWKDMTFVPHLLNLLGKKRIEVSLLFSDTTGGNTDRKELARQLHSKVLRLKNIAQYFAFESASLEIPGYPAMGFDSAAGGCGQVEPKPAAFPRLRLNPNRAAHPLDGLANEA